MYEPDSSQFTSKPDPKNEFANYFRKSGAAAALQKAMILMYRMPIKSENPVKFFSDFFENGAQKTMQVSLLKAELCYKRSELEGQEEKVKISEQRIAELLKQLHISEEEFNERFVPTEIKESNRLSVLERYFRDLEKGKTKLTSFDLSVDGAESKKAVVGTDKSGFDMKDYDPEGDCLRNVSSEDALKDDLEILDPWGIVCRMPVLSIHDTSKTHHKHGVHHLKTRDKNKTEDSNNGTLPTGKHFGKQLEEADKNQDNETVDDDDARSLAEAFYASVIDDICLDDKEGIAHK